MNHSDYGEPHQAIHYDGHQSRPVMEETEEEVKTKAHFVTDSSNVLEQTRLYETKYTATDNSPLIEVEEEYCSDMNSDDVMMARLFQACDQEGRGRVRVSDLIEYLRTIVDMPLHEDGAVANLIAILDPDNIDAEIGREIFHSGLHKWIDEMKSGQSKEMNVLSSQEDSVSFDSSLREAMESSTEESCLEESLSVSDLSSKLTDCQYLNRKLSEENQEARSAIESKEEELLKLSRELQSAKSEIKRLQELADFRHEAEAENEELRQQMITQSKELDMEKHRLQQMEQEKTLLHAQLQRFQAQVVKLTSELTISQEHQEELRSNLNESKETIAILEEARSGYDAQLSEKDERFEEMQACLREIYKNNEDLKNQNQDLQGQLIESQQELTSLKSEYEKGNGIRLPSLRELADEIEEDAEQPETKNTCEWPSSIRNELRDLLSDSPDLAWPLSEKELKESVVAPDLVSQVGDAANKHGSEEEILTPDGDHQPNHRSDRRDSTQGRTKCTCDFHYDISNEKLRFLVTLLKKFKEENLKLRSIVKQSVMTSQSSSGSKGMEKTESSAISRARSARVKFQTTEDEVTTLRQSLLRSEGTIKKLQKYNQELVLEVTKLKRSNVELAEKLHKSELQICDLNEEAQIASSTLEREKQKTAELEENLSSSTLARQLDLRDIWRLVQKDVEHECQDFQEDGFHAGTADQIKEKIKRDIEALRTKLQKREAALGALKKNNLNLPLAWDHHDMYQTNCWYSSRKLSPGSPLVDALTIDVFNGNFPMYHPKYPYPPSVVSCEDVDCYECRAARLLLHNRYTTSCPSVTAAKLGKQQQHQENSFNNNNNHIIEEPDSVEYSEEDYQSVEAASRTMESATDSDFSVSGTPRRQRSLYGSHRRQDFIRSSGRCVPTRAPQAPDLHENYHQNTDQSNSQRNNNEVVLNNDKSQSMSSKTSSDFSFSNDLPSGYNNYLNTSDNLEPASMGVRRSSFKMAVEHSQHDQKLSCGHLQSLEDNNDSYMSTEDLRRPSFHAAIEHGREGSASSLASTKRKVVQIASPEVTTYNNKKVKDDATDTGTHKHESKLMRTESASKSVTFNLEDDDAGSYGGVYTGALAWGSAGQKPILSSMASTSYSSVSPSSSISSGWGSTSPLSSFSSYSGPGEFSRSQSLGSRSGSDRGKKLEMLEEKDFEVTNSVEDWDVSPVVNTDTNLEFCKEQNSDDRSFQEQENNVSLPEDLKEPKQERTDVSASEGSSLATEEMPASMNHHSLNVKEVIRGHNGRDGPVHSTPERCSRALEGKPPTPTSSSTHLSTSHGTRRGATVTSAAAHLPSSSSKSSSSASVSAAASSSSSSSSSSALAAAPAVAGAPSRFSVKSSGKSEEVKENTQTRISNSHKGTQGSDESSSSEVESPKVKTVVPASPPTARNALSATQQAQPLGPSRLSKIRQNHLATKKREQMKARSMKLPELAEHSELDTTTVHPSPPVTNGSSTLPGDTASSSFKGMPQISVTDEDADMPPPPSDEPVTPSLPEAFLKKLGLTVNSSSDGDKDNDVSVDQLPEKEIESKFISLSLAFKTDKLTLDQRVSVQERSRDLAEQNVDRELQGLREAVEALGELVSDDQVRSVLQKIKQHIDVLEQSAARVSSRAEVYGAVQQERRMCKAMEVMVLYTENLRRLREREESELQEARKVLSERAGNGYSLDDSGPGRRSMSVCGFNASGRPMRRRSEVALPRVLGGVGSPSLIPGASLESAPPFFERSTSSFSTLSQDSEDGEDPKARFQSAVASTSMQHVVTNTMRRASLDKQRSVSMSAASSSYSPTSTPSSPFSLKSSPPMLSVTKEVDGDSGKTEGSGDKTESVRKISQEEDAFRKGFEEGLKTKLSQELNDLRDQQNSISQNLEHVMDKVDQSQLEDEEYLARPSRLETTLALASKIKDHVLQYDWRSNKKAIRNIAGVFFVLLAIFIVYLSPPISTVDVQHFPKPPQ